MCHIVPEDERPGAWRRGPPLSRHVNKRYQGECGDQGAFKQVQRNHDASVELSRLDETSPLSFMRGNVYTTAEDRGRDRASGSAPGTRDRTSRVLIPVPHNPRRRHRGPTTSKELSQEWSATHSRECSITELGIHWDSSSNTLSDREQGSRHIQIPIASSRSDKR